MAAPTGTASRVVEYLAALPDPFPQRHSLLEQYKPEAAPSPTDCLNRTDSHGYTLSFLATYNSKPRVLTAPFTSSLPGFAPEKHILFDDVTTDGQLPDIIELTSEVFRLTANHNVVNVASTTATWTNNQGEELLPPVADNDPLRVELRSRKIIPIPHEYAARLLQAQDQGTLTWRWLWTVLIDGEILGDLAKEGDYQYFIEYVRVASTASEPTGVQPHDPPPTDYVYPFGPVTPAVRAQALQKLKAFLPGLGQPGNVNAQLIQLQQQQQQHQAAALAAQVAANQPATIQSTTPQVFHVLTRLGEVATEADLPAFHRSIVNVRSGRWMSHAEQALATICMGLGIEPPILSPTLVNDIATGRFTGVHINDLTRGFSPLRWSVEGGEGATGAAQRNLTYNILSTGGGVIQADAVNMMFAANEIDPPRNTTQFQAYLEGHYGMLATFIGENSRATTSYRVHVFDQVRSIATLIERQFSLEGAKHDAYLKVLVFIARETDHFFLQLLHPFPGAPPPPPPDYAQIYTSARRGQIRNITMLPEDLMVPAPPVAPPRAPGPPAPPNDRNQQNQEVHHPNQNRNLKAAWAATQHVSIFRAANAPYRDNNMPKKRKIVPADPPDTRHVCIPMALTGKCYAGCSGKHEALSDAEVQRVAQAGGFTV